MRARGQFPDVRLTPRGVWTLAAGVVFLAAGVLASSWTLVLWGQVVVAAVALARLLAEPESRSLFAGRVSARVAPDAGSATVGKPLPVRLEVAGAGGPCVLRVVASAGLGVPDGAVSVGTEGRAVTEALPVRSGHGFVYGVRLLRQPWPALFELEGWYPSSDTVRILPAAALTGGQPGSLPRRDADLAASHRLRRAGLGSEFRELRDHRPGDPYRAIAWKPSARRRRLLVREFESEVRLTLTVLLDVSPSMRRGAPGATPLDRAVDVVVRLARPLLAAGDRVGLVTFDQRPVHRVLPAGGRPQLHALLRPLLEVWHAVESDLTEGDAQDVAERAALHIRYQEGLEVRDPPGGDVDPGRLDLVVRQALLLQRARVVALGRRPGELAPDRDDDRVRLFCRLAGVHLDYRRREAPTDLERGLVAALELATRATRGPAVLVVVSDLIGRVGLRLHHALRALRAGKDRLVVLAPHPAADVPRPEGCAGEVHDALAWADDPRARPAAVRLRAVGTPVVALGREDPLRAVMRHLGRLR